MRIGPKFGLLPAWQSEAVRVRIDEDASHGGSGKEEVQVKAYLCRRCYRRKFVEVGESVGRSAPWSDVMVLYFRFKWGMSSLTHYVEPLDRVGPKVSQVDMFCEKATPRLLKGGLTTFAEISTCLIAHIRYDSTSYL